MIPAQEAFLTPEYSPQMHSWWRVLLTGLLLSAIGVMVLILTGNPNLFPTLVMLGNFLVPVTYVAFVYGRRHLSQLTLPTTAMSFFYGGVLGVLVIARRRRHDSELDGLILGAAAGMAFAGLESNGYAFTAFLRSGGSLSVTVMVTLLRGLLSPVGHGTWTAILASVLFRESAPGRFHLDRKVVAAYLTVSLLHGLWDGLPGAIAALVTSGVDVIIGQAVIGAIGLFILWRRWREAVRLQSL